MKRRSSLFFKSIENIPIFNIKRRKLQSECSADMFYPLDAEQYELMEEIGKGDRSVIHKAKCLISNKIVAIKCMDVEEENIDLKKVERELTALKLLIHPNVLISHCVFMEKKRLWQVMPFMAGGSLKSILSFQNILKSFCPVGLQESVIATALKEVLKALHCLHKSGHIHRDVRAANILLQSDGSVKITGFAESTIVLENDYGKEMKRRTFAGTVSWMAPEVIFAEERGGYDCKADIWSLGITAMELANGRPPFCEEEPMKTISQLAKGMVPIINENKFSKEFKDMVKKCLMLDPHKRPSAKKLLKHAFFKQQAKTCDHIVVQVLNRLPPLTQRMKIMREEAWRRIAEALTSSSPKGIRRMASYSEVVERINEFSMKASKSRRITI